MERKLNGRSVVVFRVEMRTGVGALLRVADRTKPEVTRLNRKCVTVSVRWKFLKTREDEVFINFCPSESDSVFQRISFLLFKDSDH